MLAASRLKAAFSTEPLLSLKTNCTSRTFSGDARELRKVVATDHVVDAVVTSPPYLTAQDYFRSSKLELAVIGFANRRSYIDLPTSLVGSGRGTVMQPQWDSRELFPDEVEQLRKSDHRAAAVVVGYCDDLRGVGMSLADVIKKDGSLCFIVGNSVIRGISMPVNEWAIRRLTHCGFSLFRHETDRIRDRRLRPKRQGHDSVMSHEHLFFFSKGSATKTTKYLEGFRAMNWMAHSN